MPSYFQDPHFQNKVVAHVVKDRLFLKDVGSQLEPDDFKPSDNKSPEQWARWITGTLALNYFEKYKQPVGQLLRAEVLEYVQKNHASEKQKVSLLNYVDVIRTQTLEAGKSLVDKIWDFKKERARFEAVEKVIALQNSGELTDEIALQTFRDAVRTFQNGKRPTATDFLQDDELDGRVTRRFASLRTKVPLLFIDPLDMLVKGIARRELGLILAPYKRGKSQALIHIALAYAIQGLNVLFVTAEDTKATVEDRFDAAMTQLPIRELPEKTETLRIRFARMRRYLRGRLFVTDATEGNCTFSLMEKILEEKREEGIIIDALIVDYDDEIVPPLKRKGASRREEFSDIYRAFRQLLAKHDLFGWTAAQTQRGTEGKKIIRGDDAAEDISKLRKVTMCLSIGNGDDVHEEALYLFVAAHKNDRKMIGTYIRHDMERGVFYHRERTRRLLSMLKKRRVI